MITEHMDARYKGVGIVLSLFVNGENCHGSGGGFIGYLACLFSIFLISYYNE